MGNPLRDGRPVSTRDHRSGPAYEQWKIDRQAELDAENAAAQAAADAAEAADPVKVFQKMSDAEAQAIRNLILTGYVPESILSGDRVNGRKINEDAAVLNFKLWAQQESTFQRYMFETLYAAMKRNDLAPTANNFGTLHRLLLQYAAYPDEPVAQPVTRYADIEIVDPMSQLTPSEQAVYKHQEYCEKIIGHDENGQGFTEAMLDQLPAKDELRLRRLFEQGHRGSNLLTVRREILDIKAQQDAERNRIAQEKNR